MTDKNKEPFIKKTAEFVKKKFADDASGHDWWHIYRVWQTALKLAETEKADRFIVEMAALLHDLDDWKLSDSDEPVKAKAWMEGLGLPEGEIQCVLTIVSEVSFKGADVPTPMSTLEGQVVQDADRLDAIGAIGVARAFAFGGNRNRSMYDPAREPQMHASFDDYKKDQGHTINHFYEKLLLLKDRMNTISGSLMAVERHAFMEVFLDQFYAEWNAER